MYMKRVLFTSIAIFVGLFCLSPAASADEEIVKIRQTIQLYIDGTAYSRTDLLEQGFAPESLVYLDHKDHQLFVMKSREFIELFDHEHSGEFGGRYGSVLTIERTDTIAMAKAEILIPEDGSRFIDYFLLKRLDGQWKIISKSAIRENSAMNGAAALIKFSENASVEAIENAYLNLRDQGMMVEFVRFDSGNCKQDNQVDQSEDQHRGFTDPSVAFGVRHPTPRFMLKERVFDKVVQVTC